MNKKNILIAILAIVPGVSAHAFSKIDMYGGIAGGFSNLSNKYAVHTIDKGLPDIANRATPINSNLSANGISGDVFIGVGKTFNKLNMNLSTEVDANLSNDKINYQFQPHDNNPDVFNPVPEYPTQDVKQKLDYSFGVSLLPGLFINANNLVYTRAGLRWAKLESDVNATDRFSGLAGLPGKHKQNLLGYKVGLGIQSTFYKSFALRAEYDYTGYQKPKDQYADTAGTIGKPGFNATYSNHPSTNAVTLGFVYYIGKQTHNPNRYMDPVAWLQNKFSHGQVMQNEDQTMVASNDQGDKVKASDTSDSQQPNQDMTVIAHQDS